MMLQNYRIKHEQGCYFPSIRILAVIHFLQYNSHTTLRGLDVVKQISCLFQLQTHDSLALISEKAASQRLRFRLIEAPTS